MSSIDRLPIAPNGPEFSRLVYGTWRFLDDPISSTPEAVLERFKRCLDLGITTIDAAEIYGLYKIEELIGQALKLDPGIRQKLEIVTKNGIYVPCEFHPDRKVAHYNVTAARIIKSAEKSLRLMGIDHIDLLLVHRPDWLTSADETAEGLNKLLKEGKIRSAGVSNYNVHQFELLNSRMDQPLVTNQVEFSLLHMDPIYDGTADQCQRHRILPMAWSPLGGGRLMDPSKNEAAARIHKKAAELSAKYDGATVDQLAYAWLLAHPSRPLPVIGTNKLDRINQTAKAATIQLVREDWYGLWEAAQGNQIP
ncbi:MAG: aldo/keto reductase [Verrucomicrobiales bacterium]|nr:aldo/keto reductase [Verrucomicrobiales bacterium]